MALLRQVRWLALILLAVTPVASAAGNDLVKAQLLANVSAIQPGQPFEVGVLFKISPGWHIYWKNAGDAGAPTTVDFKVPDGFKVSELKFPAPVRFEMPGPIVSFGYDDEVMLLATITPSAQLPSKISISATANWLVCKKSCIQGTAGLKLDLPDSQTAQPANQQLFEKWAQRLPISTGQERWVSKLTRTADGLQIEWRETVSDVQWFGLDPEGFTSESTGDASKYVVKLTPQPKRPVQMKVVVAFKDSRGIRHAIEEQFQVRPKSEQSSGNR